MLKTPFLVGAAALALHPLSVAAQDDGNASPHAGHARPAAEPKTDDPLEPGAMDHGTMNHGVMNHSNPATPAEGSGTARLPANEGGHSGLHIDAGNDWTVMMHGFAWGVYTDQSGPRGDDKAYVQSMLMLSGEKQTDWGRIQLKSMMSLEPLMSNFGYPNLFATGETAGGEPLIDRQHPHDLFMELAARIDVNVGEEDRKSVV